MARVNRMKYRLALKLAEPVLGQAALGWAMLRLKDGPPEIGHGRLPYGKMRGQGEVRVVVYDDPGQMLEPMPVAAFEERLKMLSGTLPDDCELVRVPFDAIAYTDWRGTRSDSHELRSEWALALQIDEVRR